MIIHPAIEKFSTEADDKRRDKPGHFLVWHYLQGNNRRLIYEAQKKMEVMNQLLTDRILLKVCPVCIERLTNAQKISTGSTSNPSA